MRGVADAELAAADPAPRGSALRRSVLDTIATMVALVVAWQLGSMLLGREALPSPLHTLATLGHILADPDFPAHAWETLRAFGAALAISLLAGLALGILLGASRLTGEVAEPILVALYSIPKVTLYPVILLLFGLGISAKVAFGVIHGIIPVMIFTMNAVRNLPRVYLRTAATLHLTPWQAAMFVVVPAAMPEIVSGFRVGFALTLLGTLIGEMFASQRGLGYMLVQAMETNNIDIVMAVTLLLIVLAASASALLLALDRKLHHRVADSGV